MLGRITKFALLTTAALVATSVCFIWFGLCRFIALVFIYSDEPILGYAMLAIGAAPTALGLVVAYEFWRFKCTSRSSS